MEKNEEDKVWVSVDCTVNLGNYENVKISMGQSRTIKPDENPDDIRMNIYDKLIEDIADQMYLIHSEGMNYFLEKE